MPRRVTPSQLQSMIRKAEREQRQAINRYTQEARRYKAEVKRGES